MIGYFKEITVPSQLQVGQQIEVSVDFYALNPGAWYWKTFLIADSPQLAGFPKELDATREIGQEGGRRKTYNLGVMPGETVALSFFLFGHDDASYDWDWGEYQAWMGGFPASVVHLASEYKFIAPSAVPVPSEKMYPLEVDITPSGGGYVRTSPVSSDVPQNEWTDGTVGKFTAGTAVQVTAFANTGYRFEKWSDEIEGGVSYNNPAYVKPMTEHRAVKCHFREVAVPAPTPTPTPISTAPPTPSVEAKEWWKQDWLIPVVIGGVVLLILTSKK